MFKYLAILFSIVMISCGGQSNNSESGEKNQKLAPDNLQDIYKNAIKKYDGSATDKTDDVLKNYMYVNGYRMASSMKSDSLYMDMDYLLQGIADGLKDDGKGMIPRDKMDSIVNAFSTYMTERVDEISRRKEIERSVNSVKNQEEADEFLAKNAKEPDVITLPSGLQYKVLSQGQGPISQITDHVLVHMTSTFPDGTVFDDTRKLDARMIPNSRMIPGWYEAVSKMPVGSRWKLFMPPALAFGEFGAERVPANKLIILDVELIKIMNEQEIQEYMIKNPPKTGNW